MDTKALKRRIRQGGATALLGTLAVAGTLGASSAAGAATKPTLKHHATAAAASSQLPGRPGGPGPLGTVSSVSSTSLILTTPNGTKTFTLTSSTTYTKDESAATIADVASGEHVAVVPSSSSSSTAASVNIISPSLAGTVVSVSGSTIVIADEEGFYRTIQTSASTTYKDNGSTVTSPTISTGDFLVAIGSIDADHTTLDATLVCLGKPPAPKGQNSSSNSNSSTTPAGGPPLGGPRGPGDPGGPGRPGLFG